MNWKPSEVDCKYGAPLGRPDQPSAYSEFRAIPDFPHKFYLRKVKLDSGGYDQGGAYWGLRRRGESLWQAESENGMVERWFDAPSDRAAAKAKLREEFPNCTFFR